MAVLALAAGPATLTGQTAGYQELAGRCLRFQHIVLSRVATTVGSRVAREDTGWDGDLTLLLRRDPDSGPVTVEAWFTRLAAWRETPTGRISHGAEGIIGGRYRGRLSPLGRYASTATPFVPQDLRAVADMAPVLDDLLPPRPGRPLAVGESWSGDDWSLERLADVSLRDVPVERYAVTGRRQRLLPRRDTGAGGTVLEEETGIVWWSQLRGPERWERELRITVTLQPDSLLPRGGRSEIAQSRQLIRLPDRDQSCRQ